MKVECPCANCRFHVWIQEGLIHDTKEKAFEKLRLHIVQRHTFGEIQEWWERCLVDYFQTELRKQTEK